MNTCPLATYLTIQQYNDDDDDDSADEAEMRNWETFVNYTFQEQC